MHWHTPAENTIDGVNADMEAHYVHQLEGDVTPLSNLVVLAVHYRLQDSCNQELETFWAHLPPTDGAALGPAVTAPLQSMLAPLESGGVFHWSGSLTTPPCAENVDWYLFKRALPVCSQQLERLKASLAAAQAGVEINNRATQPLFLRQVTQTPPVSTEAPEMLVPARSGGVEQPPSRRPEAQSVASQVGDSVWLFAAAGCFIALVVALVACRRSQRPRGGFRQLCPARPRTRDQASSTTDYVSL